MASKISPYVQSTLKTLNSGDNVNIEQWTDEQVGEMLNVLFFVAEKVTNKGDQYTTFCACLFKRWSLTSSKNKGNGLPPAESSLISLDKIALTLIENGSPAFSAILPYIDPHFHSHLFLRHAIQKENLNAVRLLLPLSDIRDVANFGVEMANHTANNYLLDIFLPHADPTALDYYLVRHATHRCAKASDNKDQYEHILQKILHTVDQVHIKKNQMPLTDNLGIIKNVVEHFKPSVRLILEKAAQEVRFKKMLEQEAFSVHAQITTIPPSRKM